MTRFRSMTVPLTVALGLCLAALPAAAKPGGTPKSPQVKTASPKSAPKVAAGSQHHAGKTVAPKAAGAKAPKTTSAKAPKTTSAKAPKTTSAKAPKTTTTGSSKKTATATGANSGSTNLSAGSGTGSAGSVDSTTTLSKAQQQLTKNTQLAQKMESRLPAGSDVIAAASGFRNLGQFEAAVNASYNQGYSFEALKALMTGPEQLSLGQAKKQLRSTSTSTPTAGSNATTAGTPTGTNVTSAGTPTGANATSAGTTAGSNATTAGTPTGTNVTSAGTTAGSNATSAGTATSGATPSTGTTKTAKSKTRTPGGR